MALPDIYNLKLKRRADHTFSVNLTDGNDNNINLTGKTIISQIWDESRTNKLADVEITIVSPASGGNITWKVTDAQTAIMSENTYFYDILKIDANGDREYFIEGKITMIEGYTAQ
tara:strand:- start:460 stop:804 length:345 start_codon:yes stop_codon:yes gene_type:complete